MELHYLLGLILIVETGVILYFRRLPKREQITAAASKPEPESAVMEHSRQLEKQEFDIERIDQLLSLVEEEEENLPSKPASRRARDLSIIDQDRIKEGFERGEKSKKNLDDLMEKSRKLLKK